jgi:GTP cyclohydrolase IA
MPNHDDHPHRHVAALIAQCEPYPDREGLHETPARYCRALQEMTTGYAVDVKKLLKTFGDGGEKYDEMVFVGAIPFYSLCEHHLVPFFGVAHVGYIPLNGRIVGLSKIARLVDAFAKRFTVQERITTLVADTIAEVLKAKGVAVQLQARHMCMEMRGVSKPGAVTTTQALRGLLANPDAKAEFAAMVAQAKGVGIG